MHIVRCRWRSTSSTLRATSNDFLSRWLWFLKTKKGQHTLSLKRKKRMRCPLAIPFSFTLYNLNPVCTLWNTDGAEDREQLSTTPYTVKSTEKNSPSLHSAPKGAHQEISENWWTLLADYANTLSVYTLRITGSTVRPTLRASARCASHLPVRPLWLEARGTHFAQVPVV